MKMYKKLAMSIAAVALALSLSAVTASAVICSNAEITKIGQRPALSGDPNSTADDNAVFLKCDGWQNARRYFLSPDLGDKGLATFLTAFSLGKHVDAYLASTSWNSLITDVYILPTP